MLKKLLEEGYLNPYKMLLKEQNRLNLTADEVIVLTQLIASLEKKKNTVSMNSLSKSIPLTTSKVGEIFNHLIEKAYIHTELEMKSDGKEKEIFSLDPLFKKLEELFQQDICLRDQAKHEHDQAYIIKEIEKAFNKSLKPYDFEIIKEWFIEGFSRTELEKALQLSLDHHRKTVGYMDRILRSDETYESQLDEKKKAALDKLIRGIR